ncbi:protein FAR1-RELATED SEQUENCE 5-like isoform X2 [Tasmannia lanceolata]|uniref:protein FAR1-RELATED SEQUENCE 5-like isoform X2 n=1 Tax=Tasmannia lanceolata TaxID=3420 RepID=UPI004062B8CC
MEGTTNESGALKESYMGSEHTNVERHILADVEARVCEIDEMVKDFAERPLIESEGPTNLDPYVGMEFGSEEAIRIFYNEYAWRVGFSIRTNFRRRSKRDGTTIALQFVCSKEGFRRNTYTSIRQHTREGCGAMIKVKKDTSGKWIIIKLIKDHNHELATPGEVPLLRSHRRMSDPFGKSSNIEFTSEDCTNYIQSLRKRALEGDVDASTSKADAMVGNSVGRALIESERLANFDPYVGMEFESEEAATIFYYDYAWRIGFSIRTNLRRRSRRDGTTIGLEFVCSKEGFRRKKYASKRRQTREGCKAMFKVKKGDSGKWNVIKFVKDHNHALASPREVPPLRLYKRLFDRPSRFNNTGSTTQDRRNYILNLRKRILGGDPQYIVEYFKRMKAKNASFFYAIQVDEEYRMTNFFWADARSRLAYNYCGDVVTFDTAYRTNRCGMPFAPFIGVNHHKKPVLFGCSLLLDETEASFVWLFETWLEAMSGCHPITLITDLDPDIGEAVAKVFPKTHHHFCKWHILRKFPEKLGHIERKHHDFVGEFSKCINLTELNQFESSWQSLIDKYELQENRWLQTLYKTRKEWVHVYVQDVLIANVSNTQQNEIMNSIFHGYVNADTSLKAFVYQCEKSINSQYEKELEDDSKTSYMKPIMKTGLPMENQAAEIYTRTIFLEFQEQLFQSLHHIAEISNEDGPISTFGVVEFGLDKREYTVTFNASKVTASCSCQMFEYAGILCKHILRVFSMKNVMLLPSHCILKRWTKSATGSVVFQENDAEPQSDCQESPTLQYTDLFHRAIKYAAEGATTVNICNVARHALQKAFEEVVAAKKSDGMVTQPSFPDSDGVRESNICDGNLADNASSDITFCDPQRKKRDGGPNNNLDSACEEQPKKRRKCQICKHPDHDKRKCPYKGAGANSNIAKGVFDSQCLHHEIGREQQLFSDRTLTHSCFGFDTHGL